ncbi:hypothetical protein G7Z17_g11728 [Cylindrodendrum hubeiense]|uniref:chitin synthase n=1 Tax=Cylindrodendrum hubeiense TaxID=595255 RepID=A0A9P5H0F8_9HYPO|nr:hypothetical protein G7Z17_g11728 [Cylindrodendrum hubeiense]
MDPLSIASGCAGLITAIGSLSLSIHAFVRTCREARGDLDRVSRELFSLQTVLELIQEDVADDGKLFPPTLERQISGILSNCTSVVLEVQSCITKYGDGRLKSRMTWTVNGQGDMEKLRTSLEAHKSALELALDMLTLSFTREIRTNTTKLRDDTAVIKHDITQILQEITRLQGRLPEDAASSTDFILQRFLEEMTNYTEQELDTTIGGHEDDRKYSRVFSYIEEQEEVAVPLHPDAMMTPNDSNGMPVSRFTDTDAVVYFPAGTNAGPVPQMTLQATDEAGVLRSSNLEQGQSDQIALDTCATMRYGGNLVLDCPVSQDMLDSIPHNDERNEFTDWRFTAVMCPPEELKYRHYYLRPMHFARPRRINIVMSFRLNYAETAHKFATRWHFILQSMENLNKKVIENSNVHAWKHILVHIHGPTKWAGLAPGVEQTLDRMGVKPRANVDVMTLDGEQLAFETASPIQTVSTATVKSYRPLTLEDVHRDWMNAVGENLMPEIIIDITSIDEVDLGDSQFLSEMWFNQRERPLMTEFGNGGDGPKIISLSDLVTQLNTKPKSLRKSAVKLARRFLK